MGGGSGSAVWVEVVGVQCGWECSVGGDSGSAVWVEVVGVQCGWR